MTLVPAQTGEKNDEDLRGRIKEVEVGPRKGFVEEEQLSEDGF